ncbi:transposase IS200 family protein [Hydrogenoanaerobacterium saccharovorans]|uniref:Transposase IS200 like n=1 Tax=Hydrogenoanaerobacterium saccharovorans TaxID=474960 RepID=A0A1H8DK53_9FIRM|nr:transposase IS200 family protein [Hydrogenoanaerobacterium saccharovorans]SEN07691.1 Transposase IS200 like [Hydrogenoanaerobacterium saccharovorans]
MDENSLSHTKWKCQYHIIILPKYRRKAIYGKLRKDIGGILRKLCEYKHVEIIEAHAMPDHIHLLLSIPPKLSVGEFMGCLKGKSTLMIFEQSSCRLCSLTLHNRSNFFRSYDNNVRSFFFSVCFFVKTIYGKSVLETGVKNILK